MDFGLAVALIAAVASIGPAAAQKQGGTLRSYIWDNPPSASIHEEATISTVFPFMPVFNNLVVFDQTKLEASLDTIVPDLGLSWAWDAPKTRLTFKLAEGVKWHDGKPFTAKDVKCTFDLVAGLVDSEDFRKNPRRVWYHNVAAITTSGDHEVSFQLKAPQPSFLALARLRLLADLSRATCRSATCAPSRSAPARSRSSSSSAACRFRWRAIPTTGRRACRCSTASSTG